jgi:sugar/nucleoside kinase (ribokinase family)
VRARARALTFEALPERPFCVEVLHLAPVLDEIPPEEGAWARAVRFRHLVANPQGWFREVEGGGRVRPRVPDLSRAPRFEALVVSEEDLAADPPGLLSALRERTEILVLTRGAEGASLFWRGKEKFFPARKRPVVDPTGAGDVLAGAFFALLFRERAPEEALRTAMELAALAVTRPGLSGVPTSREIANLLFQGKGD